MHPQINEYNEILNEVRRFARNEIRPEALDLDLYPDPAKIASLWRKSLDLDIPCLLLPQSCNGAGYPPLCGAFVLDVLASECAGVASVFAHHLAASIPVSPEDHGRPQYLVNILSKMDSGKLPVASVIFPSDMGDQALFIQEKNSPCGSGPYGSDPWVINGESALVGNSSGADAFCAFIHEDDTRENIACVFVEKNLPGIAIQEKLMIPGLKINPFGKISFNQMEIASDAVIASGKNGKNLMKQALNAYFGFIAAMAMGTARTAWTKALSYAKQRYQFGDLIIRHGEIQRMLGVMKMKLDVGTAAYIQVFQTDRVNLPGVTADGSLAKAYCTQAALEIVLDAIQIHGGYGYMHEYGLEKIMRDVKILQLLGGRNPQHHVQAIAEEF
ncbi:MAG: acyl-CoA/acyl-ACP dehydrogenase [Desulfobacteraceae bacterium]|nr:acyl-CoA/acyl-ACP dehydrogenase [Desulfobacteraceae bacterium]